MFPFARADRTCDRALWLADGYRFEEAAEGFQAALDLVPDDARLRMDYALSLAERGDYEAAVAEATEAVEQAPANAVLPMFLGVIHLDDGRCADAREWLERSAEIDPANPLAPAYLALTQWDTSGDLEAVARLAKIDSPLSGGFEARLLIRVEDAMSRLRDGVSAPESEAGKTEDPDREAAARRCHKARDLLEGGRPDAALDQLARILTAAPATPEVCEAAAEVCPVAREHLAAMPQGKARLKFLHTLACVEYETGYASAAREHAGQWLAAHRAEGAPRPPRDQMQMAVYVLARVASAEGNDAEALTHLEELRTLAPREPVVDYMMGSALLRMGERGRARHAFERLLGKAPVFGRERLGHLVRAAQRKPEPEDQAAPEA